MKQLEQRLFEQINRDRTANGAPAVKPTDKQETSSITVLSFTTSSNLNQEEGFEAQANLQIVVNSTEIHLQ